MGGGLGCVRASRLVERVDWLVVGVVGGRYKHGRCRFSLAFLFISAFLLGAKR